MRHSAGDPQPGRAPGRTPLHHLWPGSPPRGAAAYNSDFNRPTSPEASCLLPTGRAVTPAFMARKAMYLRCLFVAGRFRRATRPPLRISTCSAARWRRRCACAPNRGAWCRGGALWSAPPFVLRCPAAFEGFATAGLSPEPAVALFHPELHAGDLFIASNALAIVAACRRSSAPCSSAVNGRRMMVPPGFAYHCWPV